MRPQLVPVREVNSAHDAMMAARDVLRRRAECERMARENAAAEESNRRAAALAQREREFLISDEQRKALVCDRAKRHADEFLSRIDKENRGLYPARSRSFATKIILWVANRYGHTAADMTGIRRTVPLVHHRRLAICMIYHHRKTRNLSLAEVGRIFCRDHTTIIHAIRNSCAKKYASDVRKITHISGMVKAFQDRMRGDSWEEIGDRYLCSHTTFAVRVRHMLSGKDKANAELVAKALGITAGEMLDRLKQVSINNHPIPRNVEASNG